MFHNMQTSKSTQESYATLYIWTAISQVIAFMTYTQISGISGFSLALQMIIPPVISLWIFGKTFNRMMKFVRPLLLPLVLIHFGVIMNLLNYVLSI